MNTKPATIVIREASGNLVRGQVHGAGGAIAVEQGADTVTRLITRATAGKRLFFVYEPSPGHVRAYFQTAASDLCEGTIDLRGASLVSFE